MRALRGWVLGACVGLAAVQVAAQVTVEAKPDKKGKNPDTFVVKAGAAPLLEVALLHVADYPAQALPKRCQDPIYQGLKVRAAWYQAVLQPAAGAVAAAYDGAQKLERMGYPAFPLASVQGPGCSVTVHWVTTIPMRAISDCVQEGRYDWWHSDTSGPEGGRQGLLLDVSTDSGREWYLIEKCGEAPATLRKLAGPGSAAELTCPPVGK